jgi:hypothetical protein
MFLKTCALRAYGDATSNNKPEGTTLSVLLDIHFVGDWIIIT